MPASPSSPPRPIVIGAGLAGLACARELHRAGLRPLVFEANDRPGGRVRTEEIDGFLIDRGFQVLNTWYPEARRQLDFEALQLRPYEPGALVRVGKSFHHVGDPFRRPLDAVDGLRAPVGSPFDKLRVARLRWRCVRSSGRQLMRGQERSAREALASAGFSERMIETFFEPFFGGVFLEADLATSSRWFELLFRSFSLGQASLPADGMQAIPRQICDDLPVGSVLLGTTVDSISADGTAVTTDHGVRFEANAVVVATEEPAAHQLLQRSGRNAPRGAKPHRSVRNLTFNAPYAPVQRPVLLLNGNRHRERDRWGDALINNMSVPSQVQPTYAPTDRHLVSVTTLVSEPLTGPSSEAELRQLESDVREQLTTWFGPVVDAWRTLRVNEVPYAQPRQEPGQFGPVDPQPIGDAPIYLAGDHCETTSIHGALVSGRKTAAAVIERLRSLAA